MKKRINATFEINNDLEEYNLITTLEGLGAMYLKVLPDIESLKDDKHYKALRKAKKDAESNLYDFINKNR